VYHEPIRVAYRNVVDVVPKLLTATPKPDIVLHIGLAASRRFFAIEQGAHSRGYGKTNDVDGELFPDSEAEKVFPDSEYPSVLHTGFDTDDVLSRWRTSLGQYQNPLDTIHHPQPIDTSAEYQIRRQKSGPLSIPERALIYARTLRPYSNFCVSRQTSFHHS
jgi:hypothetical protein